MKKNLYLFAVVLLVFSACTKNNDTSTTPLIETIPENTVPVTVMGSFINGPYGKVMGAAKLVLQNGKYTLALENMIITNGPDLHVYLSKEIQPVNFIDLGKLKSTAGNQLYDITGPPDFAVYKYALIHCQQFNHLFGSAVLQ